MRCTLLLTVGITMTAWAQNEASVSGVALQSSAVQYIQLASKNGIQFKSTVKPGSPEQAVQEYILQMIKGAPDSCSTLQSLVSISPYVKPTKLAEIKSRLGNYRNILPVPGSSTTTEVELFPATYSATFNNLATVCVLLHEREDELQYAVLPFAVWKREGKWVVSLTPASFDNAGLPYDSSVREAAKQLEVQVTAQAKELATQRLNKALKQMSEQVKEKRKSYASLSSDELLVRLLEAAESNDTLTMATILWPCFAADRPVIDKTDEQRLALTLAHLRRYSRSPMRQSGIQLPLLCDPGVTRFPLPSKEENGVTMYNIGCFSFDTGSFTGSATGARFGKLSFVPMTGTDGMPSLGYFSRFPLQLEDSDWDTTHLTAFREAHPTEFFRSAEEGATQTIRWMVEGNAGELMRHMSEEAFSTAELARRNAVFLRVLMASAQQIHFQQNSHPSQLQELHLFTPGTPLPKELTLTPSQDGQSVIVTAPSPNEFAYQKTIAFELRKASLPKTGWYLHFEGELTEEQYELPKWDINRGSDNVDISLKMMPTSR